MRIFFHLFIQGLLNLGRNKWAQIFTLSAVTFVSFLAGLFLLLLYNFNVIVTTTQDKIEYQVYWEHGYPMEEVEEQWALIAEWDIDSVETFTPEQALQLLVDSMGSDFDPGHLSKSNPLPSTALIEFSLASSDSDNRARSIYNDLQQLPGIDRISYNPLQMDMARNWLNIVSRIFVPLIGLMFVITGLVVANTLKLNQINRKEEVEILSLIGASSGYIRLPLIITGAVQGMCGGILSVLLLKGGHLLVKDILYFAPLWVRIDFLPVSYVFGLVGALTMVGIISSLPAGRDHA
ncbi:cell division protein FtsX [Desulfonatronovibrio magnus]|uniref:cell division protein FtsX n=1 Tax=Desulfonatronovibrio magnus TaxID=698827 RepID=UPI0005EAECC0|nr:FtsX-like permease family protein [Desulfonatronovibrio magnus]